MAPDVGAGPAGSGELSSSTAGVASEAAAAVLLAVVKLVARVGDGSAPDAADAGVTAGDDEGFGAAGAILGSTAA